MEHQLYLVVLGLFALLLIASLLHPLSRRINFPFTVLLALGGVVLGLIVMFVGDPREAGLVGDFLYSLQTLDITSEAVFFLFLPALIFESAMSINVRHLFKDIGAILMLAVVGLLISTFASGAALTTVSDVGFVACLLLGAIISATDPVAVVAIFKDLGAPKRLTILVEGESLFNDATAIVLFTILMGVLVAGAEASAGSALVDFIRVFFGGIAVGLVASRAVAWVIGRMRNMPLVEITLTVVLAYLAFLIAEHYLHVSGVMAVVTAGLVMGSYGRTKVSPATWHGLHETWEQLGFWANSLIFFLVGILVPNILKDFTGEQAIALVVLIAVASAARLIVLFVVLPLMTRTRFAQPVSAAFRTIMFWGGLRGAVSLALALLLFEAAGVSDEIKNFVVVLVTSFVLVTLFINATTIRLLMALFGLDKLAPADAAIRDRVMALSLAGIKDQLEDIGRSGEMKPEVARVVAEDYEKRLGLIESKIAHDVELSEVDRTKIGLGTLVNRERQFYLKRFSDGVASDEITRVLLHNVDVIEDALKSAGPEGYDSAVRERCGFDRSFRFAVFLQRRFGATAPLSRRLAERFEVLIATQGALVALRAYAASQMAAIVGEAATETMKTELVERAALTDQAVEALRLQYPDYFEAVQRCHLGRVAARLEDQNYRRMLSEQIISQQIFDSLQVDLDRRSQELETTPQLDLGLEPETLVGKVPFFAELDQVRIREIAAQLKPRLVLPDELVVRKGETGDAMYFVSTGAVQVEVEGRDAVRIGSGDFFGEIALVRQTPRIANVRALGYCQVLALYARDFEHLMQRHPELRETIEQVATERLGEET
jgi:CPA1 family monovalent cation:H+ antiporter